MSNAARVEALFFSALEKGTEAERADYLNSACGGDAELRRQVEKLLSAHPRVGDFLKKPIVERLDAIPEQPDATQGFDDSTDGQDDEGGTLDFLRPSTRPDSLGRIGQYEALEVLSRGGFGIVFRAYDETLQRVVAVKVLAPQLAVTSPARKRFLREARSSAKVRHANVVQIYAVEEQPLPYLVMEFIPGETLQQRLNRTGPLEVAEVLLIGRQIAEGLAAAHARGLIHRDIKPANLLIEAGPHQHVKITDFGLARAANDASMTQSGIVVGTPMYMAPEQARGEALDHRADLFSLGSVLYTMCCGRPPFRANSTLAVLKRVTEDTPRPIPEIIPEVPPWLCDIISRLHAKKPEDRLASAQEVADLLARYLVAPPPVAERVPRKETPQSRYRFWAAAAVIVTLLGGLGIAEASGVTDVRGTVIRLFSPEGTLVVEVDDPSVSVMIDGSDLVITGAGIREIRLKPGRHTVEASKGGKVVRQELVTVTKNGRQVVRVSQEAPPDPKAAATLTWERAVAVLPAEVRVKAVAARLRELNPGFDGEVTAAVEDGAVRELRLRTDRVTELSPVRVLTGLRLLECAGSDIGQGRLADLSPLRDLPLTTLRVFNNEVFDLSPLKGMKLKALNCGSTKVGDLSPLAGMPLEDLDCSFTKVSDLSPLRGIRLTQVAFAGTEVTDLSPLKGMPLEVIHVGRAVTDLSPLKGMPLVEIHCIDSQVSDLSPLNGMTLTLLACGGSQVRDVRPLRGMMSLKRLWCCDLVSDLSPLGGLQLKYLHAGPLVTDLSVLKGMPLEKLEFKTYKPERDEKILRAIPTLKILNDKPAAEFWK